MLFFLTISLMQNMNLKNILSRQTLISKRVSYKKVHDKYTFSIGKGKITITKTKKNKKIIIRVIYNEETDNLRISFRA